MFRAGREGISTKKPKNAREKGLAENTEKS